MSSDLPIHQAGEHCLGCVYYPPNLPLAAYPAEDYRVLREKTCSFDFSPQDKNCAEIRKTSCSLVDLAHLEPRIPS